MGHKINIHLLPGPAVTLQPPVPPYQAEGSPQSPGPALCHPAPQGTGTAETGSSVTRCTRCLTEGLSPSPR